MTDSEIIKALNKWLKEMHNAYKIHLESGGRKDTDHEEYIDLMTNTIDLINRQKAEIERLKEKNNRFADIGKMYSEIKSEAIKEFAERLIKKIDYDVHTSEGFYFMVSNAIDNLVKEMVGE